MHKSPIGTIHRLQELIFRDLTENRILSRMPKSSNILLLPLTSTDSVSVRLGEFASNYDDYAFSIYTQGGSCLGRRSRPFFPGLIARKAALTSIPWLSRLISQDRRFPLLPQTNERAPGNSHSLCSWPLLTATTFLLFILQLIRLNVPMPIRTSDRQPTLVSRRHEHSIEGAATKKKRMNAAWSSSVELAFLQGLNFDSKGCQSR